MTIGEISLLGFSGMHLNVNINESVLKMLKTHKGVEKEKEFPYAVCKGCVAPDCVHQYSEESSPKLNSSSLPRNSSISFMRSIKVNLE